MNKLVILTGPTAVGKTSLSINLAKALNGEIISADSAQVYKGLDIGSAKITEEEMDGVPHHLIDVYDANFSFDVTVFQRDAKRLVDEITARGHIPIVVGGTGFYIQALLYDIDFTDEDSVIEGNDSKEQIEAELTSISEDPDILHDKLREVDPVSAEKIHKNNIRKVIRALEFYKLHGYPISQHNENERKKESAYDSLYFVLNMNRDKLYDRINRRVDIMRDSGLVEEVEHLLSEGVLPTATSMQAIGYKEIIEAIMILYKNYDTSKGKCTEIESNKNLKVFLSSDIYKLNIKNSEEYKTLMDIAFEKIKLNTRHFAKRQLTWFRREKNVIYLDKDEMTEDEILEKILSLTKNKEL